MTRDEVIRIAHLLVEEEGWPWDEPVIITRKRRFLLFGKMSWYIRTNTECRGTNVNIEIDDKTGTVLNKHFALR